MTPERGADLGLGRVGAVAALAYGLTLLLAIILITPPFLSGPAGAFDPLNSEARVQLVAGLSPGSRALLQIGFPLEFLNVPLLVIAFVALWAAVKDVAPGWAAIGVAAAVLGCAFLLIDHIQRFLLLALADRYPGADAAHRAGLAAVAVMGENLSQTATMAFNALLGTGLVFFALALARGALPGWLRWFTWVSGALCVVSALLSAIDWRLGFVSFPALVLFAFWTMALGVVLWRSAASSTTVKGMPNREHSTPS